VTVDDLERFIVRTRAEAEAALQSLAAIDTDALPAEMRRLYDDYLRGWQELYRLTDGTVVAMLEAACRNADTLSPEDVRGFLVTH
jgi:hypothetical protein